MYLDNVLSGHGRLDPDARGGHFHQPRMTHGCRSYVPRWTRQLHVTRTCFAYATARIAPMQSSQCLLVYCGRVSQVETVSMNVRTCWTCIVHRMVICHRRWICMGRFEGRIRSRTFKKHVTDVLVHPLGARIFGPTLTSLCSADGEDR